MYTEGVKERIQFSENTPLSQVCHKAEYFFGPKMFISLVLISYRLMS